MACCEKKTKNIDMFHLKYHPLLKKKKKGLEEEVGKEGPGEKGGNFKGELSSELLRDRIRH